MKALFRSWVGRASSEGGFERILKGVAAAVLVVGIGAGTWLIWSRYQRSWHAKAWAACSGVLDLYGHAFRTVGKSREAGEPSPWNGVAQAATGAAASYAGARVEPFLDAIAGQAHLVQGDRAQALSFFRKAYDLIPSSSSYASLIALQYALVQADDADPLVAQAGTQMLAELSQDTNNEFRPAALYYVGYRAWVNGDSKAADAAWSTLNQAARDSVWARRAENKRNFAEI